MDPPPHPENDDVDPEPATPMHWATVVFLAVLGAILAAIVILHFTGVVGRPGH